MYPSLHVPKMGGRKRTGRRRHCTKNEVSNFNSFKDIVSSTN